MSIISLQPVPVTAVLVSPLVVVIPIFNESATIGSVVSEWTAVFRSLEIDYQFLLINDGSSDDTMGVLRQMEASDPDRLVVVDKPNAGHGRTCRLGYSAAAAAPLVEWVLQIDSDGQCDSSYFEEFWSHREEADCIFGRRVQRDDGYARAMTSKFCKFGASLLGGRDMVDPNVPYRIPASFNIHNVALTFILKKTDGVRWVYVPIRFRDRQGGSNSINLSNVAHWGFDMLLELRKLK